jgi:DNA repair exonuclease SbcCD nuclease subunit
MTIAHLSDTHLGFRAYSRLAAGGFNQREVDVMDTFTQCLRAILERDPDIVVHAGDLFHVVRPSNATIVKAFQTLTKFQAQRNNRPFILIGGNHDTPRTLESGNILSLFADIPGVYLTPRTLSSYEIPDYDLEVMAVPSNSFAMRENFELSPVLGKKHSLLTLHGMSHQALPEHSDFDVEETRHERWTYVALGDYHSFQPYGKNVCYAGSTDFASTNIWDELKQPKGWVWFDTETGLEHVPLRTRRVIDLPRIDAAEMKPEEVERAIRLHADWPKDEMPIVRQRIYNLHPAVRSKLDYRTIREIASQALNYQIHATPPARRGSTSEGGSATAITLERSWEEHVVASDVPAGIDRQELKTLGVELLKEVAEREARPTEA